LSLLETLYFGAIPIVKNHESTSNLVSEFDQIYCYDSLNPKNISIAILKAINGNNVTRKSNIFANREIIEKRYTQEINLQQTLEHYLNNE